MKILDLTLTPTNKIIQTTCQVLSRGGLVVFPSETTYGIGADATNGEAVDKLLQYKARREGKPLSIAVADQVMAEQYATLNDEAKQLYRNFLPGPITVISKNKGCLAHGVASERGTIGVRIPNFSLIRQIIKTYGKPITATSANASYKKRPYNVSDILDNISLKQRDLIDLVIDAGELPHNEPSTVIDTTLEQPAVLRQGAVKLSEATIVTSSSAVETQEFGKQLVTVYKPYINEKALIFALVGELGTGKTQLSKGIAQGLGIVQPVTSPTFTIAREYGYYWGEVKNQFIHIDTWRLFSNQEFIDLGFVRMIDNLAIISIEWADKVKDVLIQYSDEAKIIWIKIEYAPKPDQRIITYSDHLID